MGEPDYDVIQLGYGPVSEALALFLGRQGRSVAVCERWEVRYPLPRAVCVDHELYRVLAANGMGAILPRISHPGPLYQWFNADWRQLLVIDWSAASISGGPEVNFVHQPTLEAALDEEVRRQPSVQLLLGWEAISVDQGDTSASVLLRHMTSGEEKQLSARYILGCDGANSMVREAIGGGREDRGFEADWLVIDVLLKDGVTIEQLGIPAAGQYCNPSRPTTIVPAGVRDGRKYRRWEFMRLPGETVEELETEQRVWALLRPWADETQVELIRHKIYNFRSLIANRWRNRRLIIAGDAAHVMPPFMGQGMCSGMRDAWNLAWKLGLVLDEKADDRLLDTYQPERAPHVSQVVDISIYLGKMICLPDAEAAARRDESFLSGSAPPPPPFPHLTGGLLHGGRGGTFEPGVGMLCPHVHISRDKRTVRLDDWGGVGRFLLVGEGFDPILRLDGRVRSTLSNITASSLALQAGEEAGWVDADGRLLSFMRRHGWAGMIVRPDFYVYGGVATPDLFDGLAADLVRDLVRWGLHLEGAPRPSSRVTA